MNTRAKAHATGEDRQIHVVLVDDHVMVRKGVELLLRSQNIAVVGVANGVGDARSMIERRRPDVALVDIRLADGSGIELAQQVASATPSTRVLLYTGGLDENLAAQALRSSARGVMLKAGPPAGLIEAVRTVAAGGMYFDPQVDRILGPTATATAPARSVLTRREREVFELLAGGMNGEDVAADLVLSPETVRTHIRNGMRKLHARTRVHALALALQADEISL
jgi:DNA-binding NarL/FixJ family response regulator